MRKGAFHANFSITAPVSPSLLAFSAVEIPNVSVTFSRRVRQREELTFICCPGSEASAQKRGRRVCKVHPTPDDLEWCLWGGGGESSRRPPVLARGIRFSWSLVRKISCKESMASLMFLLYPCCCVYAVYE